MTARQVAESMSIREFVTLCAAIDVKRPPLVMKFKHGDGTEVQDLNGGRRARRFTVINIERVAEQVTAGAMQKTVSRLYVTVDIEQEPQPMRFKVAA